MDAREVLPLFAAWEPDILLLDLHMPFVTGFDLITEIQSLVSSDVFFLCSCSPPTASRQTRQAALELGANDFLTKPFDTAEVALRTAQPPPDPHAALRISETAERERTAKELARVDMLERLARTAELRDNETYAHTLRVGDRAARLPPSSV